MKKKGDVVINITPSHCELFHTAGGGFDLWFYDKVGNDYARSKIVKIHFKSYWLGFIAKYLWQVQIHTQKLADKQAKALEGKI